MSFAVDAFILKPVEEGISLCISGTVSSRESELALRVNGQVVPVQFRSFDKSGGKELYGRAARLTLDEMPESVEILEDAAFAWASRRRDLKLFDGISFSIWAAPAKDSIYVHGWCFYDGSTPIQAEVFDAAGKAQPVFRTSYPDLESQYVLDPIRPAFSFALPGAEGTLVLSWKDQRREIDLAPHLKKSLTQSSRNLLRQGVAYLRRNGFAALWQKSQDLAEKPVLPEGYQAWFNRHAPGAEELAMQKETRFAKEIRLSLVMTLHDPDWNAVEEMLSSIEQQSYSNWQLCLSMPEQLEVPRHIHDKLKKNNRIQIKKLSRNLGEAAALNEALAFATGDYAVFIGQEDLLAQNALYEIARILQIHSASILYADEDKYNDLTRSLQDPWFKPDFSPDLLRGGNYMGSMIVMESALAKTLGGFSARYEGAQMYDLLLRGIEEANDAVHIPKVLYHKRWRPSLTNIPMYRMEAGARALASHLARIGQSGSAKIMPAPWNNNLEVSLRLRHKPMISVISMTRDPEKLEELLMHLRQDGYGRYEVISPNPQGPVQSAAEALNAALPGAHGELILFLAENTMPVGTGVLEGLASRMQIPGTSMSAGRLLQDEQTVLALGDVYEKGNIYHRFKDLPVHAAGYMNLAQLSGNVSLTPFDGVMFFKQDLINHHGLDPYLNTGAWADFCLSLPGRITVVPGVSLISSEIPLEERDLELLCRRHPNLLKTDPYYSTHFEGQKEIYGTSFA